MVVLTISYGNTVHAVTNDFVMILFKTNLPSEFKSSLAYPITIFNAFCSFPIRAIQPSGLALLDTATSVVFGQGSK
jgi:hypothetical protein